MEKKGRYEPTETLGEKKAWITPKIFDSPVIEATEGTGGNLNLDGEGYS